MRIAVLDYLAIFLARHMTGDKSWFMLNQKELLFYAFVRGFSENGQTEENLRKKESNGRRPWSSRSTNPLGKGCSWLLEGHVALAGHVTWVCFLITSCAWIFGPDYLWAPLDLIVYDLSCFGQSCPFPLQRHTHTHTHILPLWLLRMLGKCCMCNQFR